MPKSATRCARGEQDVLGLDVAMQDAVLVGVLQGVGHFAPDPKGVFDRELPSASVGRAGDSPST